MNFIEVQLFKSLHFTFILISVLLNTFNLPQNVCLFCGGMSMDCV